MIDTALQIAGHKNINPLKFITGLKYTSDLVKSFNNMTFLFDPNWEYEAGNPTYPISFFYVKSMTEVMTSEVSQKPMLFYNSSLSNEDSTKGGLLNIVADNIVIKPKIYKLDLIIPANIDAYKGHMLNSDSIANVYSFLADGKSSEYVKTLNGIRVTKDILETLFKVLYGAEISASSIFNMMVNQQDYNKNSIEFMWRNRRILKLKLWNGWKFKYLVIQNFEPTKKGEDNNYYEGTLTCQEIPILTCRNQVLSSFGFLSTISSKLGSKVIKSATNTFIKAMEASYGTYSE